MQLAGSDLKTYILIIIISVLAVAVASAAYSTQGHAGESFDSDLPKFLKRTDSSLLTLYRQEGADEIHLDKYSLSSSNPVLYQFFAGLDSAYAKEPDKGKTAQLEVIISKSQSRAIMNEIMPELKAGDSEFSTYSKFIEMGGRHYALTLMTPK
jgi:hypothetical protein